MSKQYLLSNLKDIHLPPEISIWPLALGWWLLIIFLFLFLLISCFWLWRRYKLSRPKIEGLKLLNDIQHQYDSNNDIVSTLVKLSNLIRRIAITIYTNENVASLHGLVWLEFLDKSGKTNEFTNGIGRIFGSGIYKKDPKINIDDLFPIVKNWVKESTNKKI